MSKLQLHKYINDDELDLSVQNLAEVPVKEISKFQKLRFIDLSCNVIENIPVDIGLLVKITKLDLSKNKLKSIPEEIGKMVNLEHLDLRDNKLATLPLGICDLKKLKWLDLKGNPLNENLRTVAGLCLDESQCVKCAKNVLACLETMRSKKQKSNDKRKLKEDEMLKQKAIGEKELRNRKKLEKTQERLLKRKAEEEKLLHMKNETNSSDQNGENLNSSNNEINSTTNGQSSVLGNLLGGIFALLLLAVVLMSVLLVCNHPLSGRNEYTRQACNTLNANLPACLVTLRDHTWQYLNKYAAFISSA